MSIRVETDNAVLLADSAEIQADHVDDIQLAHRLVDGKRLPVLHIETTGGSVQFFDVPLAVIEALAAAYNEATDG